MNCTKCGKEIPDGENTLCEECQKLEEKNNKAKKEKKEKKPKEKKDRKDNKQEKDDDFKVSSDSKEKGSKTKVLVVAVILVIVAILILVILKMYVGSSNVGNTIGNIRNYGYGAYESNRIYYLAPNEDSTKVGIFSIKNNGEDKQELLMNDLDIVSINAYDGYIYFIGIDSTEYSDTDEIDNKIYKMKNDGSDLEVINDNEFNNDCYEIYVVENSVYYIGVDENIYKMNLDGTNKELISENGTGYIGITDKYIIYNQEVEDEEDYVTYIMNLDGTNSRAIIDGERLYSIDVKDDYVYFTNTDKQICRVKIDSGEESELILDTTAYNLNLYGDYLYFLNYVDYENEDYTVALYRVKADGSESEETLIKELSTYSSYINVVGDWVMYMDSDDDAGFINLVKADGSGEEVRVYELNYEEYYSSMSSDEDTTDETTSDDTVTTEETDTTTDENVVEDTNTVTSENTVSTENVVQ